MPTAVKDWDPVHVAPDHETLKTGFERELRDEKLLLLRPSHAAIALKASPLWEQLSSPLPLCVSSSCSLRYDSFLFEITFGEGA